MLPDDFWQMKDRWNTRFRGRTIKLEGNGRRASKVTGLGQAIVGT